MSYGSYLVAIACVGVVVATAVVVGVALRSCWLSEWRGAPARLAEIVIGIEFVVLTSELLGTVGLFRRAALVPVMALAAAGVWFVTRRSQAIAVVETEPPVPHARWAMASAAVVASVVVAQWAARTIDTVRHGLVDTDSLQYHMPISARFAQTANLTRLHFLWIDPVWSFYPANSELLHAVGMVATGRDFVSPFLNFGWLLVALLAGWVVGRPFGVGHLTLAGVALIAASPLCAFIEPGSALTDIAALALVLSAVALLAQGDRSAPAFAVAGIAAGLAVGTKLTAVGPIVAVTVAVIVITGRRGWVRTAAWLVGMALGGGFWFVRNLVRTGNPLPWYGPLPSPRFPVLDAYGHPIFDYLTDGHFWQAYVPDGLRLTFGSAYPLVIVIALAALACGAFSTAVRRSDGASALRRILLAGAVVGLAFYAATPVAAFGPTGDPWQFGINLRYVFPALACSLALGALALHQRSDRLQAVIMGVVAIAMGTELVSRVNGQRTIQPGWLIVPVAVVVLFWLARDHLAQLREPRVARRIILVAVAGLSLVLLGGRRVVDSYLTTRSSNDPIARWAQTTHGSRIAVVGFAEQYRAVGVDLSNHVQYLGETGSHGEFESIDTCQRFRTLLRAGNYDFLVAGSDKWQVDPTPEIDWESADPAANPILEIGNNKPGHTIVYRLRSGAIRPSSCP